MVKLELAKVFGGYISNISKIYSNFLQFIDTLAELLQVINSMAIT